MGERIKVTANKPLSTKENSASNKQKTGFQSQSSHVDQILFLQRTIGNQAVQRLIKSGALQAKLRIGQPGDVYEQEAERVADEVMRMPEPEMQRQVDEEEEEEELIQTKSLAEEITPLVQRKVEEEEEELQAKEIPGQISEVIPNLEARINAVRGSGQPLPKATRAFFEPRFGYEFSQVRVHNDAKADALNRSLNARAFTTGQDVFFAMGKYTPGSSSGRELLAHELTHVIQQNGDQVQRKLTIGQPGDRYEQEADQVAQAIMQEEQQPVLMESDEGLVHRQVEEEEEARTSAAPGPASQVPGAEGGSLALARRDPGSFMPADVPRLQQTAGNRSVAALLARQPARDVRTTATVVQRDPVLHVTTGTTDELQAELERLQSERESASGDERERYDEVIERVETRIANRGQSTRPEADITLHFNGQNLSVSGALSESYPAVSGRPDEAGEFDYSRERQRMEGEGAIPEGSYWLDPSQLTSLWHYQLDPTRRTPAAWGSHRITIHPYDTTHTFGRGGFFIHGGTAPGSAGCIDLTTHMSDFVDTVLEGYRESGSQVVLHVRYPGAAAAEGEGEEAAEATPETPHEVEPIPRSQVETVTRVFVDVLSDADGEGFRRVIFTLGRTHTELVPGFRKVDRAEEGVSAAGDAAASELRATVEIVALQQTVGRYQIEATRGRSAWSLSVRRTGETAVETPEGVPAGSEEAAPLSRAVNPGALAGTLPPGAVQRIIELPDIEITGDPHFYLRALRRNRYWSNNPPRPGWPYDDELRKLWEDGSYDEFAERIRAYQMEVMGIPLDDIDGILGPNTTASLAAGGETPAAETTETGPGAEGEAAGSRFPAPPAGVLAQATGSPWRFHEPVYNRFQSEGRDLGIPGLAPTWQGYLGQMGVTRFLGRRVAGHQAFLAKLDQAEAWLRREHPELSNAQLLGTVGTVGGRTQWRAGESTASYHVFGLALDIDPGQNPWIASSRRSREEWTIWRAAWLMGGEARAVWSAQSHAWESEEGMTTQALHERFRQSSQAVENYFDLRNDQEALYERVAALVDPPAGPPHTYAPANPSREDLRSGDVDTWSNLINQDWQGWTENVRATGFMNLRVELVRALRDGGGLSWGATNLGANDSGDFMHFDMRNRSFEALRNAIRREMATAMSPYEIQLTDGLPNAINQEIETLGISQPLRQRQFRNQMSRFYNQSLSRYFGRWTDEQRANLMEVLGEMWQNSRQRARFAP